MDNQSHQIDFDQQEVIENFTNRQRKQGVTHLLEELMQDDDPETPISNDQKHEVMSQKIGQKMSALASPTSSLTSSTSNKPFESNQNVDKKSFFMFQSSHVLQDPNYDIIQINKYQEQDQRTEELQNSAKNLIQLLKLRDKYHKYWQHQDADKISQKVVYDIENRNLMIDQYAKEELLPKLENTEIQLVDGVYMVKRNQNWQVKLPSIMIFLQDLLMTVEISNDKTIGSFCHDRNRFIEQKFKMHLILNIERESSDQKQIDYKDFYSIMKVDTHVHHQQSMNATHLLKFIKNKFKNYPNEVVYQDQNSTLTLANIAHNFNFDYRKLNLDLLDVQADQQFYMRFDRFEQKYSPLGQPLLKSLFLKSENQIQGKYLAQITQEMITQNIQKDKCSCYEWRTTIYGKSRDEWNLKGKWLISNNLKHPQIRWVVQVPRLYDAYKKQNIINNFQDMIDNIFKPLFDITIDPSIDPDLYQALFSIVGFDSVDNETKFENFFLDNLKTYPIDYKKKRNPHFAYWIYYIYANLLSLNHLRKSRGLNTFKLKPHCGQSGDSDHLACTYLLSEGIIHGLTLEQSPVLQYLYYLKQIGISMSPVSNNKLVCKYADSPFKKFFCQGLNITLSTDDPLMLHFTNQPLIEEYSIASQIFDLSQVDLAEIARNSIRQCSFEDVFKVFYIGENWENLVESINKVEQSNLPQSRLMYRQQTLREEFQYLKELSKKQ